MNILPAPSPIHASAAQSDAADLLGALRRETRAQHEALEKSLDLLGMLPDRGRLRTLLGRFHGFHQMAEPALAAALHDDALLAPRRRLELLRRDLLGLGLHPEDIAALPVCPALPGLEQTGTAMGLLYVMEGSTLGGQVITRHLQSASWLPRDGLAYFRAHGPHTGAMWREVCARLQAMQGAEPRQAAIAGAVASFTLLRHWLAGSDLFN
jgi:heme oxygenase